MSSLPLLCGLWLCLSCTLFMSPSCSLSYETEEEPSTGRTSYIEELRSSIADLEKIINKHLEKAENTEAVEAEMVKVKMQAFLEEITSESHNARQTHSNSIYQRDDTDHIDKPNEKLEGGTSNMVYDSLDSDASESRLLSYVDLKPFNVTRHVYPAVSMLSCCMSKIAFVASPTQYMDIFNECRSNIYHRNLHAIREEFTGAGETPNMMMDNKVPITILYGDDMWSIAISEVLLIWLLLALIVLISLVVVRFFCGASLLHVHRLLAAIIAVPLIVSSITGALWMFCDQIMKWNHHADTPEAIFMNCLMSFHTGDIFQILRSPKDERYWDAKDDEWKWYDYDAVIKAPYCIVLGILVFAMIVSGTSMWQKPSMVRRNRNVLRRWHHALSYVVSIWLLLAAVTGQMWAMTRWWIGDPTSDGSMVLLMKQLHVGYFTFIEHFTTSITPRFIMTWWCILGGGVLAFAMIIAGTLLRANVKCRRRKDKAQ